MKAFRTKNRIISYFEEYEGNCLDQNTDCAKKIKQYMHDTGYNVAGDALNRSLINSYNLPQTQEYGCVDDGYCWIKTPVSGSNPNTKGMGKATFKIITAINIDIPIINKILPRLKIFHVSGDTKQIVLRS